MRPATMLRDPRIATERLLLRPPAAADLDDIVEEINDFAVSRMLARVPYPYSLADGEAFLRIVDERRAKGSELALLVELRRRVIGCMGLSDIPGRCEFGYWFGRTHWGKGYATEAGRAFLAYCFDGLRIDRMVSGVFTENAASLRVQEKLGFEVTGSGPRYSLARGSEVDHIDTVLTRARFREATP